MLTVAFEVCTANELDTIPGPLLDRMEAVLDQKFQGT